MDRKKEGRRFISLASAEPHFLCAGYAETYLQAALWLLHTFRSVKPGRAPALPGCS